MRFTPIRYEAEVTQVEWAREGKHDPGKWVAIVKGYGEQPKMGSIIIEQDQYEQEFKKLRVRVAELEDKLEAARAALRSK